jgi:multidrug resistance efflux pump
MDSSILSSKGIQEEQKTLQSEPMREILSKRSDFLSKWAILMYFILVMFLFTLAAYVRYPVIVKANAVLSAVNSPKEIVAPQKGKISKLYLKNNQSVKQGDIIALLESTAIPESVFIFSQKVDSLIEITEGQNIEHILHINIDTLKELGELQTSYREVGLAYQQFASYLSNGYYLQRKGILNTDYTMNSATIKNIEEQRDLIFQDIKLSEENFNANLKLFKERVISAQELRDLESRVLAKKMLVPQIKDKLIANQVLLKNKEKEILELDYTISQQKLIFKEALLNTQSAIADWKRKYVISAAVDGRIVYSTIIEENQFISEQSILGYILPKSSRYFAQLSIKQSNFGKVEVGQTVQLRLEAYPYTEFGFVSGNLKYISDIAADTGFLAIVDLPKGLVTSVGKSIYFKSGLKAEAIILTKEMTLLERLVLGSKTSSLFN